ncbi:uncharacterized protein MCYG_07275 [Microsporum canis CBS 113480]|uniref:Uncharacterized protein n=1 Tax=Arthroderma otae (strain ATCC MYA-4605 / CBS 113480) TaxID=554155 RepID=C5FY58_ARTOC|nr:uncharacterized protein MCYG_07275 [Microsporum canis CBS 113480]EEQ34456.1 predicted protein [Microsporum canis CBS 113480]
MFLTSRAGERGEEKLGQIRGYMFRSINWRHSPSPPAFSANVAEGIERNAAGCINLIKVSKPGSRYNKKPSAIPSSIRGPDETSTILIDDVDLSTRQASRRQSDRHEHTRTLEGQNYGDKPRARMKAFSGPFWCFNQKKLQEVLLIEKLWFPLLGFNKGHPR